ncbi:uncharacterized protein LOC126897224, partial [Daktulosphaira vitifoliae]|uniref:uncharacterized protein LOC126897224 n=1 Tax=Daktulosphaira vitifoliae TaxID=58002 RepID=UPI0021AA56CF
MAVLNDADIENLLDIDSNGDLSDSSSIISDHLTESEFENSSGDDDVNNEDDGDSSSPDTQASRLRFYYGKNRCKWATDAPARSRTPRHNIITHVSGVIGEAKTNKPQLPIDAWYLFLDNEILQIVLDKTNDKITELSVKYGKTATFVNHLDMVEFKAFIGLLFLSGVFKSNHEDVRSLFATDGTGRDIFRATMSLKRFLFIITALRFDDPSTRNERIENGDKLAPFSEIFYLFITNCQSCYSPSEYLTVDEMLVAFRGRCRFRIYMKSKPNKYGIKIMCLCDAKISIRTKTPGTHICVYCTKHKRELPQQFISTKCRPQSNSLFGFQSDRTIVSYIPKKNLNVVLISSMHYGKDIDHKSEKPEIIEFYNSTKSDVDTLDQKCSGYNVGRRTRRWPLAIFYAMLNISMTNAPIIYSNSNSNTKITRQQFIVQVGKSLILEHLEQRTQMHNLPRDIATA